MPPVKQVLGSFWIAVVLAIAGLCVPSAQADEWPTYAHDAARSNITAEELTLPLTPCWIASATFCTAAGLGRSEGGALGGVPRTAPDAFRRCFPGDVCRRLGILRLVEPTTGCMPSMPPRGRVRWTATTGGPIRLAPTVAERPAAVWVGRRLRLLPRRARTARRSGDSAPHRKIAACSGMAR